jgi:Mn-dependent DtxR family transcriptional regulator
MALQESGEMYLETIYVLLCDRENIHAVDVCEALGYSKPSVSRAMGILKKEGYITVDRESHIHLTERGLAVAEEMYKRHTILSSFLESIGVPADIASRDACKIEHVISEETFAAITESLARKEESV